MVNYTHTAYHAGRSGLLGAILAVIAVVAIVANVAVIFVMVRSRLALRAGNFLILSLAISDLIAAIFWVLPSMVTAGVWDWKFGAGYCEFQGFVSTLCYVITTHTCGIVAFEKFLRICWPSKHADVFYDRVVLIIILSLWFFDFIIALFPIMGFGTIIYFQIEFQCYYDFQDSASHLSFFFVVSYVIPFFVTLILYCLVFNKVRKVLSKVDPEGQPILQEDKKVNKVSYAERLKKREKKVKKQKPKKKTKEGESDISESSSEDELDEIVYDYYDNDHVKKRYEREQRRKKRIYRFRRSDFFCSMTTFYTWIIYVLLWLPFWIISYYWTYNLDNLPDSGLVIAASALTFLGVMYKPLIYITNRRVRLAAQEAFTKKKPKAEKEQAKVKADDRPSTAAAEKPSTAA